MINKIQQTSEEFLDHLDQQPVGYHRQSVEAALTSSNAMHKSSLLIQILTAIGVFFATSLILLSLAASGILDDRNSVSYFILGGLSLGLAFFLDDKKTEPHPLQEQITLASIAVGKLLVCAAVVIAIGLKNFQLTWVLAATMTALTALTYLKLNSNIDKLLSSLISLILIHAAIFLHTTKILQSEIIFCVFYCAAISLTVFLHLNGKLTATWQPLAFALLIFTMIFAPLWFPIFFTNWTKFSLTLTTYTIKLSLTAAFLISALWILNQQRIVKQQSYSQIGPAAFMISLTALFLFNGPTFLLSALTILIIGYHRFNITLLALGTLSFIYFLFTYYYQLNITLLEKSGLLLISGAILLAAWAALHFIFNKQGTSQ